MGTTSTPVSQHPTADAANPACTAQTPLHLPEGLIESVAERLLGQRNEALSKNDDLRYGTHGSLAIKPSTNAFYDHEAELGGGVLDLIVHRGAGADREQAVAWLRQQGLIEPEDGGAAEVRQARHARKATVAEYDYRDSGGELLFQVVRQEPKKFFQRRPDPHGDGWINNLKGVTQIPYRLPELLAAPDATVYVVEGEKDADRLASLGLVATCNAGGAGKWKPAHSQFLRDRDVLILPDNDDAGRAHADKILKSLSRQARSVRIVELPGLPEKGDVSDWLDAGGTLEELQALASQPDTEIQVFGAEEDDDHGNSKKNQEAQADRLVKYARGLYDLLHDQNGDVFARERATGEVRRLYGRQFEDALKAGYYRRHQVAVREQALREALGTLHAIGRFDGAAVEVNIRVAGKAGHYWLDLCQAGNSKAVELYPGGWKVVSQPPVLFVRGEAMQPLPDPLVGGDVAALWRIANVPEPARLLVLTWLVDAMRPDTPYPGIELVGEQGSGKSTAAQAIRRVIDPNACNLRGAPKTTEDIYVAAGQSHLVAYENLSHLPGPMQDALAILSTGGGYAKRKLYSNAEETVLTVRRPWIVNGIGVSVTQQDLVDRVISIDCPVIVDRQSSSAQWDAFDAALPGILGGLLDLAVQALALLPEMHLAASERPRMMEYALLGMAMARAAGCKPQAFLDAYQEVRSETVARTLDASPVAAAVLEFLETEPSGIQASVGDILSRLERHKRLGTDAWPRSAKGLGDALRRAAPALRQVGIECTECGKIGGKVRWSIRRKSSPSSPASPDVLIGQDLETCRTSAAEVSLDEVRL